MPQLDLKRLRRWIAAVADRYGYAVRRLLYIFMDDRGILKANREYLGHDYYTDIITFDYTRRAGLGGEMLISLDTVYDNADELGVSKDRELLRVIIHGVLHLCGINDKGPGEREVMEASENEALKMYDSMEEI